MSATDRHLPSETRPGAAAGEPHQTNFHARLLMQLVEDLQVPFTHERSLRLGRQSLLTNRFLLTVTREEIGPDARATLLALCRRLAMPEVLVEETRERLGTARFVHFGFEDNATSCLYKVYLEFKVDPAATAPVLLHLAFKWDIADNSRHVRTEYLWHPRLTTAQIVVRLAGTYRDSQQPEPGKIAQGILEHAARSGHLPSYLEVTEGANGRRSFDLNLYDANLRVQDLQPFLVRMCRHFSIPGPQFESVYQQIKDRRFGHLAGGTHRDGQEFFNLYYGAEKRQGTTRSRRAGWSVGNVKRWQHTTEQDQYYNYCWWPYLPVAPVENKLRSVNLLWHSFEVAGLGERAGQLVESIQADIGLFRTVWGAKWLPANPSSGAAQGRLAWEFYFYDYQRRERTVSISRLLRTTRPFLRCDVPVNEGLPYFMFSLDVTEELLAGRRDLDVVHMYIGNPGSKVSSGIAYALTAAGTTLENFYFFFDARRDLREVAEKISCSAHVDTALIDLDRLLVPELRNCHTICVANKQKNDTVYFSGVNVEQLLFFLRLLHYPPEIIGFVEENRGRLDHLLYDVGFDYVVKGRELEFVKSGFYGVF